MNEAMLQERNSNDYLIPRDEFTFISDPDSLEDVVIYEMVKEYQANRDDKDDDIVEIKQYHDETRLHYHSKFRAHNLKYSLVVK